MHVSEAPSRSPVSRPRLLVVDALTHFGGTHRVMTVVLPRLRADFEISVIDSYGNGRYRDLLRAQGLEVTDLGLATRRPYIGGKGTWKRPFLLLANLPRLLRVRRRLTRYIREWNPNVVYTNQQSMVQLLATLPGIRRRCFVWHCHGMRHPREIRPITRWMLHRRIAAAIAVSQATAAQLRQAVRPDRVHVCYNGIRVEEVERAAAAAPWAPLPVRRPSEVVFLMPATLQRKKGQYLAVEALAAVVARGADASIWLAGDVPPGGDPEYATELKAMAGRLGVAQRVHFLGWRDDVWAVMAAADVVMLGSLYDDESFGLVLAEAMVLGKPCIGPQVGGVPEVIEDGVTGFIFEPRRADLMAETMVRIVKDAALREAYGRAGRSRVTRLFSASAQVEGITHVLKALLSATGWSSE